MTNSTVCQSKWKPIVEPGRAKPKTYRQAPTHWLKFYEGAVIVPEEVCFGSRLQTMFTYMYKPSLATMYLLLIMREKPLKSDILKVLVT